MFYHSDMRRSIELDPSLKLVLFSLAMGFILNMIPYPDRWFVYKPDFVALIMVYWALKVRKPFSVSLAFIVGILMDVAYSSAFGQHVFSYVAMLMIASVFRRSYLIAGRTQQVVIVVITLATGIAAALSVSWIFDSITIVARDFQPALVGAFIWLIMPLFSLRRLMSLSN